jgi:hypothetical protein
LTPFHKARLCGCRPRLWRLPALAQGRWITHSTFGGFIGTSPDQQPSAGTRARVAELTQCYVGRSPETECVYSTWPATPRTDADGWIPLLVAFLEQFAVTAIGTQGESLTLRRP